MNPCSALICDKLNTLGYCCIKVGVVSAPMHRCALRGLDRDRIISVY